jgi:uroporphyrinogen-III decarboxylase
MLETIGTTAERVLDVVSNRIRIDTLSVHEDMAGKSGPLAGPSQVREFIAPYYRRCWDLVADRGATLFQQDSDGNMNSVVDAFLEAGINCMLPMEPAAGMDIVATHRCYGKRLAFMGGIDKHVLRQGTEALERELVYKLQPEMQKGGTVFGLDHRIPNGTPITMYRTYVRRARELLGLDPNPAPGWQRMAF